MARREVADVQGRPRVADARVRPARRDEAIGDAALVEHLERSGVEPSGPPPVELLVGPPLDDEDIDPRQRQLGREHQPRRSPSRDHHLMLGHRRSPAFAMHASHGRQVRHWPQARRPERGGRRYDGPPCRAIETSSGTLAAIVAATLFGMLGPLARFGAEAGVDGVAFTAWRATLGVTFLAC